MGPNPETNRTSTSPPHAIIFLQDGQLYPQLAPAAKIFQPVLHVLCCYCFNQGHKAAYFLPYSVACLVCDDDASMRVTFRQKGYIQHYKIPDIIAVNNASLLGSI